MPSCPRPVRSRSGAIWWAAPGSDCDGRTFSAFLGRDNREFRPRHLLEETGQFPGGMLFGRGMVPRQCNHVSGLAIGRKRDRGRPFACRRRLAKTTQRKHKHHNRVCVTRTCVLHGFGLLLDFSVMNNKCEQTKTLQARRRTLQFSNSRMMEIPTAGGLGRHSARRGRVTIAYLSSLTIT